MRPYPAGRTDCSTTCSATRRLWWRPPIQAQSGRPGHATAAASGAGHQRGDRARARHDDCDDDGPRQGELGPRRARRQAAVERERTRRTSMPSNSRSDESDDGEQPDHDDRSDGSGRSDADDGRDDKEPETGSDPDRDHRAHGTPAPTAEPQPTDEPDEPREGHRHRRPHRNGTTTDRRCEHGVRRGLGGGAQLYLRPNAPQTLTRRDSRRSGILRGPRPSPEVRVSHMAGPVGALCGPAA